MKALLSKYQLIRKTHTNASVCKSKIQVIIAIGINPWVYGSVGGNDFQTVEVTPEDYFLDVKGDSWCAMKGLRCHYPNPVLNLSND